MSNLKHKNQVQPDEVLYNCLIDACVRFHNIKRAVEVFQEMISDGINPSAVTYGILIKAYGQLNQIDSAFSTFKEMKMQGLTPNSVTYGCLIDACVKNRFIH
jgi:pentatricopeptide repeat domain-containing protein 1